MHSPSTFVPRRDARTRNTSPSGKKVRPVPRASPFGKSNAFFKAVARGVPFSCTYVQHLLPRRGRGARTCNRSPKVLCFRPLRDARTRNTSPSGKKVSQVRARVPRRDARTRNTSPSHKSSICAEEGVARTRAPSVRARFVRKKMLEICHRLCLHPLRGSQVHAHRRCCICFAKYVHVLDLYAQAFRKHDKHSTAGSLAKHNNLAEHNLSPVIHAVEIL